MRIEIKPGEWSRITINRYGYIVESEFARSLEKSLRTKNQFTKTKKKSK